MFALAVLWPIISITELATLIDYLGGNPIFVQERVGRNDKLFNFYKFRSMCVGVESKLDELLTKNEMDISVIKIKDDSRITRVGKFI